MDLTTQAHLASGSLALALGIAALVRDPARSRSRLFAALALSLALWNLAAAMRHEHLPGREAWRCIAYAGGAAAGPIALHLCLVIAGRRAPRLLITAYGAALGGLVAAVLLRGESGWMRLVALGVPLGFSLGIAAATLRAHGRSAEGRADRPSLRLLMLLGGIAALILMSTSLKVYS